MLSAARSTACPSWAPARPAFPSLCTVGALETAWEVVFQRLAGGP
jgi:hypothetical protein